MDRKKVLIAVASIALASLAITAVTASSLALNTPLYTLRMEQASSKMNFLPTAMNKFAYTTENGYNLDYEALVEYCGAVPLGSVDTCEITCPFVSCEVGTCSSCSGYTCDATSCQPTCQSSCGGTCWETCPWTCNQWTCPGFTCDGPC